MTKYQKRISGPLLDRIDIHIEVPRVAYDKLSDQRLGEPSETIQKRVEAARQIQRDRFGAGATHLESALYLIACNADMRPAEVRKFCDLDDTGRALMKTAMSQLQLSARAYHRILKLARTIADLAGQSRSVRRIWRRRCSTGRRGLRWGDSRILRRFFQSYLENHESISSV